MKTYWKSGHLFVGLVGLSLWATCSEGASEVGVESSSSALAAGTVLTFEAEGLTRRRRRRPAAR